MRIPKRVAMLNNTMILEKIWIDPTVDPSTFMYEVKAAIGSNLADTANFTAGDLMNAARCMILSKATVANLGNDFSTTDFENYLGLVAHTSNFFKKVEEVADMIAAYDSWADNVTVY